MLAENSVLCDLAAPQDCVPHSVLVALPAAGLLLLSPLLFLGLRQSRNGRLSANTFNSFRIVFCAIHCVVVGALSGLALFKESSLPERLAPLALEGALLLALGLLVACQRRGVVTSGVLFVFWALIVVCGYPEFQKVRASIGQDILGQPRLLLFGAHYLFSCVQLLLSCFADKLDQRSHSKKDSPELLSSFLSQITFRWFDALAWTGFRRPLSQEDLWDAPPADRSAATVTAFERHWLRALSDATPKDHEPLLEGKTRPVPSVLLALLRTFKWQMLGACVLRLLHDVLVFLLPVLLGQLLAFVGDASRPLQEGVAIAVAMFLANMGQSALEHQMDFFLARVGFRLESALVSTIYSKAMRLSQAARDHRTIGEIVNLMSVDVDAFKDMCDFSMVSWSAPLTVVVGFAFLYNLLGWSVIIGFAALLLTLPVNAWVVSQMDKAGEGRMKVKDERVKLMNEVLNGIKVVKFQAWERSMEEQIGRIRNRELKLLRRLALLNVAQSVSWTCTPFLITGTTFAAFTLLDPVHNILTPEITFVAIAYFNIIRYPLACCSFFIGKLTTFLVSNRRVKNFLAEEEVDDYVLSGPQKDGAAVAVSNGTFSWSHEAEPVLRGLELRVKKGELVAVVGKVGSGKSSLLSALLAELVKQEGDVAVDGSIALVSQEAWIQNATLEANVLFGSGRDPAFYRKTVEACALGPDLEALAAGDQTEIGEKGVNLSGGQKQRVSLARAVYAQKDIYLLDDPLSAVDAHVAKHLFENVISSETGLLRDKTRILVTHGLGFLKHCDRIVVLRDGQISEMGTYKELVASQGAFADVLAEYLVERQSADEAPEELAEVLAELGEQTRHRLEKQISVLSRQESVPEPVLRRRVTSKSHEEEEKKDTDEDMARLIEEEEVEEGHVKMSLYMDFFRAVGLCVLVFIFVAYAFHAGVDVMANMWLAHWSDHANDSASHHDLYFNLGVYIGLGITQTLFGCVASVTTALFMLRASRLIHEGLLRNVLRLPMAFFDSTPLGRVLNRFSKDVEATDHELPGYVDDSLFSLCTSAATIIIIASSTLFIVPIILVLLCLYAVVLVIYVRTSRQLQRLASKTRSPVYSHFQESIQGVAIIRAFRCEERFVLDSQRHVDANIQCVYPSEVATGWFAVRLDLIGNVIVLCAALFSVFFRGSDSITAGFVGLSVSYALTITQSLNFAVHMSSGMETHIVSVERIKEYAEKTPEGAPVSDSPPESWPDKGAIEIEGLQLRYRPGLEPVLKGLSASIGAGEKIGLVGRTGAGKSSLTLALFRIVEPEAGRILIDGRDTSRIDLQTLRSRLTIVPQDPVLFSGTLRMNLDPFDEFSDAAIWEALGHVASLKQLVSEKLSDGLEHRVSEGGGNLSVGQRQLICLARALLRRTRVLVLDEAAAALDVETDALIQETLRKNFRHATVLTIAHRLNTVVDYDRILVLEKGAVVEFDAPQALLARPDSLFHSMAKEAGLIH